MIETRSNESEPYRTLLPLAVAIALGATARATFVNGQSYSMDEVTELGIARGSIGEIVHAVDGFPPLYHLLLHGWLNFFGADAAARWLSVLFGVFTILFVWKLAKILVGPKAADWAAIILSVLPFHIWYSQEARAYSLYIFLAALSLWLFFRARATNRWADWAWFVVAGAAGMYAHYFFAALLGTLAICLLVDGRDRDSALRGWVSLVVLALLCVPELLLLQIDLTFQTTGAHTKPALGPTAFGYNYFSFVSGYSIGPSMRELHTISAAEALRELVPWLSITFVAVGYPAWLAIRPPTEGAARRALLVLCVVPVILVGLLTAFQDIGYNVRYASWVVIPCVVWLGAGLAKSMTRWQGKAALVLLLGLFALARWNRVAVDRYREEDSRAVATFLREQTPSGKALVTVDYMASPVSYYLDENWSAEPLPRVSSEGDGLDEAVAAILAAGQTEVHVWVAYSRPFHGDPGGTLLEKLRDAGNRHEEFAGIDLFLVDRSRL